MDDVKHTPGPWTIEHRSHTNDGWCLYGRDGYGIGAAWDCNGNPENEANARLIVAAPDLLAAARIAEEALRMHGALTDEMERALSFLTDAIAKAEIAQ